MAFSMIAASDVDTDSPITDTLMNTIRTNFDDHEMRIDNAVNQSFTAGDVLINSNDTENIDSNTSLIKVKETVLRGKGTLRIKFDAARNNSPGFQARIYRNGVAVGILQTPSSSYTTYSEDISGWSNGDTIEVWTRYVNVKNFRIYAAEHDDTYNSLI